MAKFIGIPLKIDGGTTVTPTYGSPEYVTNGQFSDASDWNITNGGWNASGPSSGSWACDGTQTSSTNLAQPNVFQGLTGKKIVISFEITAYTTGSVRFITGDGSITGVIVTGKLN